MPYVRGKAGTFVTPVGAEYEELRIKTVTANHTIPGRLVKRDSDDKHVQLAAAGDAPLGFIARDPKKDATVDFAAENWVQIGHGPGKVAVLNLDASQTIVKGDTAVAADNGRVKKAAGTEFGGLIVGKFEESVTTGAGEYSDIMVRLAI